MSGAFSSCLLCSTLSPNVHLLPPVLASPAFKPTAQPCLLVEVLSASAAGKNSASLEPSQSLRAPFYCHANGSTLWWGHVWYLQNPIENLADGSCLRVSLLPDSAAGVGGVGSAPIATATLALNRKTLDSGRAVLECLPPNSAKVHSLLHVDVALLCL